jgi:hypothetical protein
MQKGNVNDLYLLFVVVTVLFAAMWHDQPAQSGRKATGEKPDPAVLFSRKSNKLPKHLPDMCKRSQTNGSCHESLPAKSPKLSAFLTQIL